MRHCFLHFLFENGRRLPKDNWRGVGNCISLVGTTLRKLTILGWLSVYNLSVWKDFAN